MTPRLAISQAPFAALLAVSDDNPLAPIEYPNDKPNVAPFVVPCEDSRDLLPTVDYPGAPPKKPGKSRKPRQAPRPSTPKRKRREPLPSPFSPSPPAHQK